MMSTIASSCIPASPPGFQVAGASPAPPALVLKRCEDAVSVDVPVNLSNAFPKLDESECQQESAMRDVHLPLPTVTLMPRRCLYPAGGLFEPCDDDIADYSEHEDDHDLLYADSPQRTSRVGSLPTFKAGIIARVTSHTKEQRKLVNCAGRAIGENIDVVVPYSTGAGAAAPFASVSMMRSESLLERPGAKRNVSFD